MTQFKVAVLEDDEDFLKELVGNLRANKTISEVIYERTSAGFIRKVRETNPDILVLDIHLKGESTTGINVAELFDIPTIFFSNMKGSYSDAIDQQKYKKACPVEEYGKTFDRERLNDILTKFIPRVFEYQKTIKVKIKPIGDEEKIILTSDVCVIEAIKGTGNHEIKLLNHKPIRTADTTFEYFRSIGFTEEKFYKLGKSLLFNIANTSYEDGHLKTNVMKLDRKMEPFSIEVPIDKQKDVRKVFQK